MNIELLKSKNEIDDRVYIYKNSKFQLQLKTNKEKNKLSTLDFLEYNKNIENESDDKPSIITQTIKELDEYFNSKRKEFTMPLAICVKDFQFNVLKATVEVGFGEVTSYGSIAKSLGYKGNFVSRAVGRAEATNPIAIIIPCHRVLAYNNSLNGYAFGLATKEYLLKLEGHKIVNGLVQ